MANLGNFETSVFVTDTEIKFRVVRLKNKTRLNQGLSQKREQKNASEESRIGAFSGALLLKSPRIQLFLADAIDYLNFSPYTRF